MNNGNHKQVIRKNIVFLGIVSFFNDLSSEMITPILPMFIETLGGTGLIVGIIGGLREAVESIVKVFGGYWSDKTGKRKIFVFSGYFTSSVFKLFFAFSTTWHQILVFIGLERMGKGLRTAARDAIISESMPKEKGKGFGIHRVWDTSGAVVGSIIVFYFCWYCEYDFKSIMFFAATISFISLIPLSFVKETNRIPNHITFKAGLKHLHKPLKVFVLISGVYAFANFSYMFFILRAQGLFEGKQAIGMPILMYIIYNIFYALFSIPFGMLSDKIGRKNVIAFGYFLFSLTSFGFAFAHTFNAFIVLFIFYGIVYAIIEGNQLAFVSDLSSEELRATALGTFHTTIGLIALPSGLIAGFLWQAFSPSVTFVYGGIVSIISLVLLIVFVRGR